MAAPFGTPTSYAPASLYAAHVSLSDGGKSSLMVLANLLLLYAVLLVFVLQYLFYDLPTTSLVDEVFEKFILAIIETVMAMFMTGQGINGHFLLMFTSFLVGKWWALFGEGRVKRQEDHPLLVSTLLYARFSMAILLSISFDIYMIIYTAHAGQPALHPGLMTVFLFEFVNLATSSLSTATRLALCVVEAVNIRRHTRLSQRQQRPELTALTEATRSQSPRGMSWNQGEVSTNLPSAAGDRETEETVWLWCDYRRWRTYVGLATDSIKTFTYLSYFAIYRASSAIPVQFICEIFLTVQTRTKEVRDLIRLESTLRYINECSTDPAVEQVADQDSCTICCEKMKQQGNISNKSSASFASRCRVGIRKEKCAEAEDRPKRLPCGHILHWGCLKRWFEIKSTCPVCRRPVKKINKA